jgi:hypothetical protein
LAKLNPLLAKLTRDTYTDIYRNVVNDFAKQTITCSFQLMSYFVVGNAIKAILKKIYSKKADWTTRSWPAADINAGYTTLGSDCGDSAEPEFWGCRFTSVV